MNKLTQQVMQLNLTKGSLRVTDPCYNGDVWCATTINDVAKGVWNVYLTTADIPRWGTRVVTLEIIHSSHDQNLNLCRTNSSLEKDCDIGVDAGLCGFFEDKPNYSRNDWNDICDFIFERADRKIKYYPANIDNPFHCNGVCSDTGYGDGSYNLYTYKKNGEIVYAEIEYIFDGMEEA